MVRTVSILVAFVLSMLPGTAQSEDYDLSTELSTDIPLALGARVQFKERDSFRLSLGVGYLPKPYLGMINGVAVAIASDQGYTDADADVVRQALANSLVVRIHGGWQLTRNLYIDAGYGFVGLGGGLTGEDLLILATGFEGTFSGQEGNTYDVSCTLHMLDVEVGWEWDLEPWVMRAAVGAAFTLGSSTDIKPGADDSTFTQALITFSENYLNDLFTSYVHSPTLSFSAGYRFF
ncbi:MAG: hypothetical protein AAFS10_09780 [Myxococcota bacterium]